MEFIDAKEFKILIDEYHNLLKQYSFRDKAINGVLAHFKEFKSYCFISATPIPNNLKPAIFNDIPEYIANWNTTDEITVYPYHTNTPYMIAAKFIKTYQSKDCLNVNGVESKEAYFFINSVTEIKAILKQTQLTEDNYRIICADNPKTEELWKDILYQVPLKLLRNSTSSLPNHLKVWTSIQKQVYVL